MSEDKFDFAFVRVKFREIRPDNLNPRHHRDPEADLTLRRLIDTHGTIDIMWICKGENDHFRLLDGHRRYDIRVEDKYLETNPTVTCAILLAKDNPDRLLTEEEITLWRILRERGKEKWKDFDFYLKAVEHADSQKEKGRKYFQIAREDFDWNPERLSRIKSVIEDPILSDFLRSTAISMEDATRLLNLPAETQKDLIERRDDLSACELRETVKLVREGMETASAIESVKHPEEEIAEPSEKEEVSESEITDREALIKSVPEDLQERLLDATKDLSLHDTRRIVKQVNMGVRIDEAIRAVKLSRTPEIQVKEEALPEENGDPTHQLPDPSGKSSSETVNDGTEDSPLEQSVNGDGKPLTSVPETTGIVGQAFERGGEKGTEDEPPEEEATEDEEKEKKPTDPKIIKFVNRMLNLGVAVDSHMRHKELEDLPDASYRKLLKDYEEASFSIDGFRDFLHGRENNGSVQFNRAKRLHNAIREFDAHSISSINEATNLRSIKIETKKKLTKDVDILDNIINGKGGG